MEGETSQLGETPQQTESTQEASASQQDNGTLHQKIARNVDAGALTFSTSSESIAQLQGNGLEDGQDQIKFVPPTSVWSWIWKILIFVLIPAVCITLQLLAILYFEQYRTPVFFFYFIYTQAAPVMESYKQFLERDQATTPEQAERQELNPTTSMTIETQQPTSPPLAGTSNTSRPKKVVRTISGSNPGVPETEISIAPAQQKSLLFWCFCYTIVLYMVVSSLLCIFMLITIVHEVFLIGILAQDLIIFCPKFEKWVNTAKSYIKGIYSDLMKKFCNKETRDDEQGQSQNYFWFIVVDILLLIFASLLFVTDGPQILNYGVRLAYKFCILAFKIETFTDYKKMCYKEICKKHFKRRSRSGILPSHVPPNPIDKSVTPESLSDEVNSDVDG